MDLAFKVEPTAKESPPPKNEKAIETKYADETLRILELHGDSVGPLTTEKEKRLRRKLYWHIFGLLSAINLLLFVSSSFDLLFTTSNFCRLTNQLWDTPLFSACSKRPASPRPNTIIWELSSTSVRDSLVASNISPLIPH